MIYPTALGSVALLRQTSLGWAKGATLNVGIINSPGTLNGTGGGATSYYAGVTVPTPLTALKVGASFDFLNAHNASGGGFGYNPASDNVWDVALYASYQFNDKLSLNLRGEYLNQQGLGYGEGIIPYVQGNYSYNYYNTPPNVEAVTATIQYALWANVLSRVEFRWDHAEHGTPFGYTTYNYGQYYYNTGGTANAFTIALNLIYQF